MRMIRQPGKIAERARWYRAQGRDNIAVALEGELVADGRCKCCGRALSDPESVERGIGPDCYARQLGAAIERHPARQEDQPSQNSDTNTAAPDRETGGSETAPYPKRPGDADAPTSPGLSPQPARRS